jgi:hypothetical protein
MADPFFDEAPEVRAVLEDLLDTEKEFERLKKEKARFVLAFTSNAWVQGKKVYGTAEVVRGKNANLYWSAKGQSSQSSPFFRIVISQPLWSGLDEDQRIFLVRHEMRHCLLEASKTGWKYKLRKHDVEVFVEDFDDPCLGAVCEVVKRIQGGPQTSMEMEDDES